MSQPLMHNGTLREPIPPELLGQAFLNREGNFEAGSHQSFTLTYTCGRFGIDDSGSLRVVFRFATDQSNPQFKDPQGPGFTEVKASNNAVLECRFDPKGNIRPWDRTLQIKVVRGFMKEGDTITIRFGVTDHGSPGMRLQTFCEKRFEFRVLVDPIATYNFQTLPSQPSIRIVPGPPVRWFAVVPSICFTGKPFSMKIKAEDKWGNPTNRAGTRLWLNSSQVLSNLPGSVEIPKKSFTKVVEELTAADEGELVITVLDVKGKELTRSNPCRVVKSSEHSYFWGDLHGQSAETLGTNSAGDYFAFGRDKAFLDACAHQGNDFQITGEFWRDLNRITAEFNEPGHFVTLPGYEWSGNTALGGDRNVMFSEEGRVIRRSSHALIEDKSDVNSDCHTAASLFEALAENREWDVVCYAHCGGRYADIVMAHDGRFEKSVEVHSAWGTFEWIVEDAFRMGYRVGIVANSDGHKGRPGASYPGAGWFGAIGGLTCFLMPELTRAALLECLRRRRHYATTGGPNGRVFLDFRVIFDQPATLFHDDPAIKKNPGIPCNKALMGDIVHLPRGDVKIRIEARASSPVQRLDLFNGTRHFCTHRPYSGQDPASRIAVIWDGAEYRGRFRAVSWDGTATFDRARIRKVEPVNFFNLDKALDLVDESSLSWRSVTTGNMAGFVVSLHDSYAGSLSIKTPLIETEQPLSAIGFEDSMFDASGVLPRRVRMFRLPDMNPHFRVHFELTLKPLEKCDNPYYVRITLEDGTQAWSSPVYVFRQH